MKTVYADTHYWIAVLDPQDGWHNSARYARQRLGSARLVTIDEVLVEALNSFSARGDHLRKVACNFIHLLRRDPSITIVEQSRATFDNGLVLYEARHDKGYSLVDCISMNTMRSLGLTQILTHDRHFEQEGFEILIK